MQHIWLRIALAVPDHVDPTSAPTVLVGRELPGLLGSRVTHASVHLGTPSPSSSRTEPQASAEHVKAQDIADEVAAELDDDDLDVDPTDLDPGD